MRGKSQSDSFGPPRPRMPYAIVRHTRREVRVMPEKTKRACRLMIAVTVPVLMAGIASAQNIVVDAAPRHAVNSFSPPRSFGGAIDRLRGGATKQDNEQHTKRLLTGPV